MSSGRPPSPPSSNDAQEGLDQLESLRGSERRVAMATLVSTKGTTPKKEGAKMWVGEGGRILGSVTIGGCVDARVLEAAEKVLAGAGSSLLSISMDDEEAWDIGFTCGGTVEVLVEQVALDGTVDPIVAAYDVIRQEIAAGRRAVAVAPLSGEGRRVVVREDGSLVGSLGAATLDSEAQGVALDVMRRAASRAGTLGDPGDAFFFELHGPATTMVIYGAGVVAMPLVSIAKALGWKAVIVDGRERYATRERFPQADEIHIGILGEIAERLPCDASTVVVLVAHDYKFELPVLRTVLRRSPAYVGLLGSRKRGKAILDFLAEEGFDAETLSRIHVPVGLDLGAQTAGEIALAIAAEALAVTHRRSGGSLARGGAA